MMIENSSSSKGYHQATKQEGGDNNDKFKALSSSTCSRQWTAFRNPRIVRVSRTLGGKDRHSKVCTIRGLRDRRIRLSVPTAIQLYDLQDRLGLSQPSKVIDWLLEATKLDIDKLPPLQIPQFHHQQTLFPHRHEPHHHHHQFYDGGNPNQQMNLLSKSSRFWDMDLVARLKGKEEADAQGVSESEKGKWIRTNQDGIGSAQKLFPIGSSNTNNNSSISALLNINAMTYNNSYHISHPSNLTLSQIGSHGLLFPSQLDPHHGSGTSGAMQFSCSIPSASQLLFCPSSAPSLPSPLFTTTTTTAPYAPFMANSSSMENDPRQFNHIQILSSSSQVMPHSLIPSSIHSIDSPLRRLPPPFSSKLLDSDSNSRSSQQDDKACMHIGILMMMKLGMELKLMGFRIPSYLSTTQNKKKKSEGKLYMLWNLQFHSEHENEATNN